MAPFKPKGDQPEWRMVYEVVRSLKPDEIITLERLEEVLGRSLERGRAPIHRATRELERNQRRTLASVRGVGYRVAHPHEHLGLSLAHSARARHELLRGVERAHAADRSKLDSHGAARLEAYEATTSRMVEFLGHMSRTVDEHTVAIDDVTRASADTSERVEALEQKLREHGLM